MSSLNQIIGYTHFLVMKAQIAGNLIFDGHKPTAEEENIARTLREYSKVIDRKLSVCPEEYIADLLECYDLTFRIGYKRLPEENRINKHKQRLLRAWRTGDKNIQESTIFRVISNDVRHPYGISDKELLEAGNMILKKWIAELLLHSSFPETSTCETYLRLSLLMPLNLSHHLGAEAGDYKRKWFETNRVEDLSLLSTPALRSYRRFINSLPTEVLAFKDQKLLESKVLNELNSRTDLDPHDRQAFQIARNRGLIQITL